MAESKTVGVIAIKGGVGKTTTVVNLATSFVKDFGKKVLVVDANFSAPTLSMYLGLKNPKFSLHDVLNDKIPASDAIIKHELGFDVISSSLVPKSINPFALKDKLKSLKDYYHIILLDSSPNLNEEILATMVASDELYVVTTPDEPTLKTTINAVNVAKQKKTPIAGLIMNKVRNKKFELTINDMELATSIPVLAVLPDDDVVLEALSKTKPATIHSPNTDVAIEYKKLAGCIIGRNYKDPRIGAKFKKMFSRNMPKQEINRCSMINGF